MGEKNDRQECTCLQKLGRDEEVIHDEEARPYGEAMHDGVGESDRHGRCRREEVNEGAGSADDTCWRIYRPCCHIRFD